MPEHLNLTVDELRAAADRGNNMALALLHGRLVATVVSRRTGEHVTVQAKCRAKIDGRWQPARFEEASHVFLDVPGEDWHDKIGTYYPDGRHAGCFWTDRSADPARVWAALYVLGSAAGRPVSDRAEILQGSRCLMCGRELTDPVSIERNVGPECYGAVTGSRHQVKSSGAGATAPRERAEAARASDAASRASSRALPAPEAPDRPGTPPGPAKALSGPEGARERPAADVAAYQQAALFELTVGMSARDLLERLP